VRVPDPAKLRIAVGAWTVRGDTRERGR
jgi:hypothetical protein